MKKKMGLLGGLLMAVVVTGYSVAGTYAKYTSSLDFADEARVATWGFKLNGKTPEEVKEMNIDLFQDSYEITKDSGNYDVVSKVKGQKVVAPGTRGEYTFNVTGTAETNYVVAFNATIVNTIKTADYNPIFFRLNDGNWMNADEFETYLNTTITADTNKVYAANEELDETYKIEWMWAFDKDDTTAPTGFTSNDETDTYLAGQKGTVSLDVELTVTQSEEAAGTQMVRNEVSNVVSPADVNAMTESWGYDASLTKAVEFDGKNITGSIKANNKVDTSVFPAEELNGYYYPITIKANNKNAAVSVTNTATGKTKTHTLDENGEITILVTLTPSAADADKTIVVNVDFKEYTIDYSKLVME